MRLKDSNWYPQEYEVPLMYLSKEGNKILQAAKGNKNKALTNKFLDTWYEINPNDYNYYYGRFKGTGNTMIIKRFFKKPPKRGATKRTLDSHPRYPKLSLELIISQMHPEKIGQGKTKVSTILKNVADGKWS